MLMTGQSNHKLEKYSEFVVGTGQVSKIIFQNDFKFFAVVGTEVSSRILFWKTIYGEPFGNQLGIFFRQKHFLERHSWLFSIERDRDKWPINYPQYSPILFMN